MLEGLFEEALSEGEVARLNLLLPGDELPRSRPLRLRVQALLYSWNCLSTQLETTGYCLSSADYSNEILKRTNLERLMRQHPEVRALITKRVQRIDTRFLAHSKEMDNPQRWVYFRWPGWNLPTEEAWWELRVPRVLAPVSPENQWSEEER